MQQSIGKYQVIEHIASGGQATVVQAYDTITRRIVALKLLHQHLAENGVYLTRFLREARLAAEVAHPNVVRIFEVGREGDTHFIAMEYLPRSLSDLMRGQPQMAIDRVVHIARQMAGALEAARIHGVVHRDIKPPNVLIGRNAEAKLTDFGISRAIEDAPLTQTDAVMGTPQYMSPEQAQGDVVDTRSDIYSLGVMLYHMLTGKVPFEGDTPFEVIRKHISQRARPLRQLRPEVPVALQRIVTRCMAKAPNRRYKTPLDLDEALGAAFPDSKATPVESPSSRERVEEDKDKTITIEVTPGFGVGVRGPRRWRRAASWVRERRLLVTSAAATAIVLSVGGVAGALFLADGPPPGGGGAGDGDGGGGSSDEPLVAVPTPTPTPVEVRTAGSTAPPLTATPATPVAGIPEGAVVELSLSHRLHLECDCEGALDVWEPSRGAYDVMWETRSEGNRFRYATEVRSSGDIDLTQEDIGRVASSEGDELVVGWLPRTNTEWTTNRKMPVDSGLRITTTTTPFVLPPGRTEVVFSVTVEIVRPPTVDGLPVDWNAIYFNVHSGRSGFGPGGRSLPRGSIRALRMIVGPRDAGTDFGLPFDVGQSRTLEFTATVENPNIFPVEYRPFTWVDMRIDARRQFPEFVAPSDLQQWGPMITLDLVDVTAVPSQVTFSNPSEESVIWALRSESAGVIRVTQRRVQHLAAATSHVTVYPPAAMEKPAAFAGHEYLVLSDAASWAQAKRRAESLDGYLVAIGSGAENDFVSSLADGLSLDSVMIGLTDQVQEGQFEWANGESLAFAAWASGQPDDNWGAEDYTEMWTGPDPPWNDVPEFNGYYVVEFEDVTAPEP